MCAEAACAHCAAPVPDDSPAAPRFCCGGCAAAYRLIHRLGLDAYYARRSLDASVRPLRPEPETAVALDPYIRVDDGVASLDLMVDGLHCAACVWLIETVLRREPGVVAARVNMTTRRLGLRWRVAEATAECLVGAVTRLGYRLVPFDPAALAGAGLGRERELLRAIAVAGFAAGNVMLLSVSVWAGQAQDMGPATRDLFHWLSALIALPAIAYAGRPFFRSAVGALAAGRANMDVPIALAVLLAGGMSLVQTATGAAHAYFDSAVALLFFLLIGRYLDGRARGRARSAVEQLLWLTASAVTVVDPDGSARVVPPAALRPGMTALVAAGARVPADGVVAAGASDVDASLVTGESVPAPVRPGRPVFAGTMNLTAPLHVRVAAVGEATLLAEIVRLMELAEQGRARYVRLADRVARLYAPVVHGLAALTFGGWLVLGSVGWQGALMNAIAVLIITCPCALALAIPAVQVIASGRLMRRGVLLKSATALERLAAADTVVFDKTGTLTAGNLRLRSDGVDAAALALAASLAAASQHPLARALARAVPDAAVAPGVAEVPGAGLRLSTDSGEVRLGSRAWCGGGAADAAEGDTGPELWLARPGRQPLRLAFAEEPRQDAGAVVAALKAQGYGLMLLSGDRAPAVATLAHRLAVPDWRAACRPADKVAHLEAQAKAGRRPLMVGDGLNDAPALAAAWVSMSPASAADISQTAADVVFQGACLAPVVECLDVAKRAERLVRQNLGLSFVYNGVMIPLAVAGLVTPLIAAIAMSTSSLAVILNSLRLGRVGPGPRGQPWTSLYT
jgi:Cu2+-exporting ATPase